MPLGDVSDVAMGAEVVPTGTSLTIRVGEDLLGRVLDGLGEPLDGKGAIEDGVEKTVAARPPDPMKRQRVTRQLKTGIRALDGLLTVGEGQRIGIFAAAGVGKSTTLGMLARNTEAEINVIALIGERGREVRDFLEQDLGEQGLKNSVVVVATSNEPSLIRMKAAYVATAIAEYFRDQGKRVLFLMDSVTRFARALREVGLAAGEPPARSGFSAVGFFGTAASAGAHGKFRTGIDHRILHGAGRGRRFDRADRRRDALDLDGHIVLSRKLAAQNHYPAIDVNESVSRVMSTIAEMRHLESAGKTARGARDLRSAARFDFDRRL
jgi:FliI/YscN family ATPase